MNHINNWITLIALVWLSVTVSVLEGGVGHHVSNDEEDKGGPGPGPGKRWALLVAGSEGYENYRHQADVCHAYQILKKGGIKDENIIVFMADDIAFNKENPRPGVIINKPFGPNVYQGVPKDYTGKHANVKNLFAVISGNRSAISGGSGKLLKSEPNDNIFIFYAGHGAPGYVIMPNKGTVTAKELIDQLKKKHTTKSYNKMVIYMESCEAGSMFEGLLPNDKNIYVTTASNATEDSYGYYCPDLDPSPPPEYTTCLGDAYSISWMEDSEKNDMAKETLQQQYESVCQRTLTGSKTYIDQNVSSHVMQYGDTRFKNDFLAIYIGANNNATNTINTYSFEPSSIIVTPTKLVSQRDARLLHLKYKLKIAPNGSSEKLQAQKELDAEISHREHVDNTFNLLGDLLFGKEKSSTIMDVPPARQTLVDDWNCFKSLITTYQSHCGTLSSYGMKYSRAFAKMCNAGISEKQMVAALLQACH